MTVGSSLWLIQCCKFRDKNSLDISRNIWNFLWYFKNVYVVIPRYPTEPLSLFCRTLVGKHWPRLWRMVPMKFHFFVFKNNLRYDVLLSVQIWRYSIFMKYPHRTIMSFRTFCWRKWLMQPAVCSVIVGLSLRTFQLSDCTACVFGKICSMSDFTDLVLPYKCYDKASK